MQLDRRDVRDHLDHAAHSPVSQLGTLRLATASTGSSPARRASRCSSIQATASGGNVELDRVAEPLADRQGGYALAHRGTGRAHRAGDLDDPAQVLPLVYAGYDDVGVEAQLIKRHPYGVARETGDGCGIVAAGGLRGRGLHRAAVLRPPVPLCSSAGATTVVSTPSSSARADQHVDALGADTTSLVTRICSTSGVAARWSWPPARPTAVLRPVTVAAAPRGDAATAKAPRRHARSNVRHCRLPSVRHDRPARRQGT